MRVGGSDDVRVGGNDDVSEGPGRGEGMTFVRKGRKEGREGATKEARDLRSLNMT